MDGKSRILIVSFLGRIQVASKKKSTERQVGRQSRNMSGTLASVFNVVLPFTAPGHLVFFIKIIGNARR